MDYSQPAITEKKEPSLTDHASNAWSGFTGMFSSKPAVATDPSATVGGKRRKHHTMMKGGKSKRRLSSRRHKGRGGKKRRTGKKGRKTQSRKH